MIERIAERTADKLIGMLFHVLVPTIFFLVFFLAVKRRSNGYHAKTFQSCYLFSISIFLFFVAVLSPAMQRGLYVTYVSFILSAIVILTIGAVNHPNMHWSREELKASKKAVKWVVLMEGGVFFVLSYLGADEKIIVFMTFAVILSSVLLLLAIRLRKMLIFGRLYVVDFYISRNVRYMIKARNSSRGFCYFTILSNMWKTSVVAHSSLN